MLISTAQLSENLANPDWVVFDCRHDLADPLRGARLYHEAHIPRAFFAPVETALSGPSALESARAKRPEVVLLDIDMPGMSGYEVAAQLREMFLGGVVLIAITAHGLEGDRRRCLEAGFDRHVVKPADTKKLEKLLRELAYSL